jgi:AmiR/NasT family two-component response regulator
MVIVDSEAVATKANILVVEDEFIVAMDIKERLESMGYNVCGMLDSGERAVEKASSTSPDLVLMDIVLNGKMDGIEAAQAITENQELPIVFLTAYGSHGIIDRAKKIDPLGYIIKPFKDRELNAVIEIALHRSSLDASPRNKEEELLRENRRLSRELSELNRLVGVLPICAYCKKIRDEEGQWTQIEVYIRDRTEVEFSHSICPDCVKRLTEEQI